MDEHKQFMQECNAEISAQGENASLKKITHDWICHPDLLRYSYHFSWLGRPIIQYPQDIVAMQELIWKMQPDLIIETGIAHGGSLIFYASILELNSLCGGPANARVLGIDIDIRPHNKMAIESHPIYKLGRISMLEGSSVSPDIIRHVKDIAAHYSKIMVVLDSSHTHDHVLAELEAYAPLVSKESYCVTFDTIIEQMPGDAYPDRPWTKGDNPATAVATFLKRHPEFVADAKIDDKLLITVAPGGYLKRTHGHA